MCSSAPAPAPKIVYKGPSKADLAAQQATLDAFRQQSMQQQQDFTAVLQSQIDNANRQTQELVDQIAADREAFNSGIQSEADQAAAAMAAERQKADLDMRANAAAASAENAALVQSSYGINTAQVSPTNPLTTETPKPKKKEKESLKISAGSVGTTAGTGINIGV